MDEAELREHIQSLGPKGALAYLKDPGRTWVDDAVLRTALETRADLFGPGWDSVREALGPE